MKGSLVCFFSLWTDLALQGLIVVKACGDLKAEFAEFPHSWKLGFVLATLTLSNSGIMGNLTCSPDLNCLFYEMKVLQMLPHGELVNTLEMRPSI